MRPYCLKCERTTRVFYKRKTINKKDYWITHCLTCKAPMALEPLEKEID